MKTFYFAVRRFYWQILNQFLCVRYWFQGYTWKQAQFKVCAYRLQRAIDALDIHVFRTNREI